MDDVALLAVGPAGIVLGWWLNQHTLNRTAKQQALEAREAAEQQRVLDAVRLARDTASHTRSLLHGIYLKRQYRQAPEGLTEMMSEFNRTRDQFRNAVLSLRVQGPSWAVAGAERLDVAISKLAELAFKMQENFDSAHMDSINSDLPKLDRLLRDYIATVGEQYNAASAELPAQPDLEKEGRWQPDQE